MSDGFLSDFKNKAEEKLNLNNAKRRDQLILAGGLAITGLWPFLKRAKPGEKKKKIDPAGVLSLLVLAAMIFNQSKKEDPDLIAYRECKRDNLEPVCRAQYVVGTIQNSIPNISDMEIQKLYSLNGYRFY